MGHTAPTTTARSTHLTGTADALARAALQGLLGALKNTNVLRTKGYHVEHNIGHGQQYLAAMMLSLNLLALPFHTVEET